MRFRCRMTNVSVQYHNEVSRKRFDDATPGVGAGSLRRCAPLSDGMIFARSARGIVVEMSGGIGRHKMPSHPA
jgi:hypothetical protein